MRQSARTSSATSASWVERAASPVSLRIACTIVPSATPADAVRRRLPDAPSVSRPWFPTFGQHADVQAGDFAEQAAHVHDTHRHSSPWWASVRR
ncbi:hypothetical protein ILP97_34100 [Amycolatopsis sp. H6(2020)]|nr:hypothetical protein [Amycolatopsis sp. H6(2020)]